MPPILALPKRFALMAVPLAVLAAFAIVPQVHGQQGVGEFESSDEVRAAIERAQRASTRAEKRARSLERAAGQAEQEAEKVARQSAALAARTAYAHAPRNGGAAGRWRLRICVA